MEVRTSTIDGVLLFVPTPHRDDRGLFTRTFDAAIAAEHGVDLGPLAQDSQSRSRAGTIRGMHGRRGAGESKLVRVAHGAVHDVLVDARPAPADAMPPDAVDVETQQQGERQLGEMVREGAV